MNKEIKTTINLIKKGKKQPLLLQRLFSHLQYKCKTEKITHKSTFDKITQILIHAATKSRIQDKALELNLYKFIASVKFMDDDTRFYLIIMLIYLNNLEIKYYNSVVCCDLLNNVFGKDVYVDFMVIKYLNKCVFNTFYKTKMRTSLDENVLAMFLNRQSAKELNTAVMYRLLPVYALYDIPPPLITKFSKMFMFFYFESVSFYIKYVNDISNVDKVIVFYENVYSDFRKFFYDDFCTDANILNTSSYNIFVRDDRVYDLLEKHIFKSPYPLDEIENLLKHLNKIRERMVE